MSIIPPLKWHGGKQYLARRLVALMPRHMHYVEPYFGGGAVLLERDPNDKSLWVSEKADRAGVSEVVNDINQDLMNFWTVLRDDKLFPKFQRLCQATPLGRSVYDLGVDLSANGSSPVVRAWGFFVHCRQSRAGTFKGFTSLTRSRTRRGINGNASEWLSAVEGLPEVHARLLPVVMDCRDALKVIVGEDAPDTLFYLDPPYLHETRVSTDAYAHEMSRDDHGHLLDVLSKVRGKFMLSGYHSELYDEAAKRNNWVRREFDLPNNAAGGDTKRRMVECVWMNYEVDKGR